MKKTTILQLVGIVVLIAAVIYLVTLRTGRFETEGLIWMGIALSCVMIATLEIMISNLVPLPGWYFLQLIGVIVVVAAVILLIKPFDTLAGDAMDVCSGKARSDMAAYTAGPGMHPVVVVFQQAGTNASSREYPQGWQAPSVGEIQLVACVNEEYIDFHTCNYDGNNTLLIQQHQQTVTLYAAQTGKQVHQFTLYGEAGDCDETEEFKGENATKTDRGVPVPIGELMAALKAYVNP